MDYYFSCIYMVRIFLALTLEKSFNDQIIEIKKDLKSNLLKDANIAWQRNDQHHLTVYFVGEMEPEQINQLNKDLHSINLTGFSKTIGITSISFFPNENSQVLSVIVKADTHLNNLYKEVEKIVVNIGLGSELKAYKPHITLARFKDIDRPQYEFGILDKPLKGKVKQLGIFESEFDKGKTKFTLLESLDF